MYEGDSPLAERRAQALSLDPALLAELLGQAELRELLDPDVIAETERELQRLSATGRCRDLEGVADLLRAARAADRGRGGGAVRRARGRARPGSAELVGGAAVSSGCGSRARTLGRDRGRRAAARRARACRCRSACPRRSPSRSRDPLGDLVARYARTHGPFTRRRGGRGSGSGVAVVDASAARGWRRPGGVVEGEFLRRGGAGHASGATPRCCGMLRRRSLAALRKEVEPVPPEALARFLPGLAGRRRPRLPAAPTALLRGGRAAGRGAGAGLARWRRWCCRRGSPATPPRCSTS